MSTTLFGQSARAAIHARIDRLSPESIRRWGTMTAREMVCHDADQLRVALGDLKVHAGPLRLRFGTREVKVTPGLLRFRYFRRVLVHWLPWPRAWIGAPPEMLTTSSAEWRDDVAALHVSIGTENVPVFAAVPRRERSDRSGAAGRHDGPSSGAGDSASIRFARGWIALESSACRRMR